MKELEVRVERFNETIGTQKEQKASEQRKLEDLNEELENEGHKQRKFVEGEARLKAEAAVHINCPISSLAPAHSESIGTRTSHPVA